jgi:hypothetical protein
VLNGFRRASEIDLLEIQQVEMRFALRQVSKAAQRSFQILSMSGAHFALRANVVEEPFLDRATSGSAAASGQS